MAKDKRVRLVGRGEKPGQTELIAVQLIGINLMDGNTGLAMLSNQGKVYTYNGGAWVPLSMLEATDDNKV